MSPPKCLPLEAFTSKTEFSYFDNPLVEGELSIAVPPGGAVDYLPKQLARFHEEYPDVRVRISTAEGELGVLDLVRQGGAELGVTWVKPPDAMHFEQIGTRDAIRGYTQTNPAPLAGLNVRIETAAELSPVASAPKNPTDTGRRGLPQADLTPRIRTVIKPRAFRRAVSSVGRAADF